MVSLGFDKAAEKVGMTRYAFNKLVKNGKELPFTKKGVKYIVSSKEIDKWLKLREERKIELNKEDFLKAIKFALQINYKGHTRTDFGTSRQRTFMQAVENWTQGALGEIAFQKFIKDKFDVELQVEFRILEDVIGQDIVAVKRRKVVNPPKIRVSVKSGKKNGMFLLIPINEVESENRQSEYYVFVRVVYPTDTLARLYRYIPEFRDMDEIPELENVTAYIVGYCKREELEKRKVPEIQIDNEKYVMSTGSLHNSDEDWKNFVEKI